MYAKLIVLMFLAGGLQTFLIIGLGIAFVVAAVMIPLFWYCDYDDIEYGEKEKAKVVKQMQSRWLRKTFSFLTVWSLVLAFTCVIPDRPTVLAWAALRSVDQYNAAHPTSYLQPDKIIGVGDDIMNVIDQALAKAKKALGEK